MKKKGIVFAFEGPDGVGKTTLISAVEKRLRQTLERDVTVLSFPGRTPGTLGSHVYEVHHRPSQHGIQSLVADSLQLLHIAAHIDTIESAIRPQVEAGNIVLLDRYWWSTWVYGRLNGVPANALKRMIGLEHLYWRNLLPHAIFLVKRSTSEVIPSDRAAFVETCQQYQTLARREKARARVIQLDNSGEPETVAAVAAQIIRESLPRSEPRESDTITDATKTASVVGPQIPLSYGISFLKSSQAVADHSRSPSIWTKLALPKPTPVFDTYWRFAAERQEIFFRRFHGAPMPWTEDRILRRFKFTNAYRASDRVSQHLIRNVIYSGDQDASELFFRVVLFKLFNRIETWQRLVKNVGVLRIADFSVSRYDRALTAMLESGEAIYSGAYIMPSGGADWREDRKHRMHLKLLTYLLTGRFPERLATTRSMQEAFELFRGVPTFGDFLAYQYVTDLNYSTVLNFTEAEFVMPGPGARDGIRKCFSSLGSLSEADVVRFVCDHQEEEFKARDISFKSLWGRRLQLIDCQNLFCELGKYARECHPEMRGVSGRSRIKQLFRPTEGTLAYWYPPKWGLNERIQQAARGC